jgi:hypothetical protein
MLPAYVYGLLALTVLAAGLLFNKFRIRPEEIKAEEANRDKSWDDFQ